MNSLQCSLSTRAEGLLIAAMLALGVLGTGRGLWTPDEPREAEISRAQALTRVPGEIRSEELEREHGRLIFSFVIKPKGETQPTVRELNFDADTGEFVNEEVEKDKR